MSKKFTLGKNERLKSRKQTELLFSEGKKFTLSPFRIFYTWPSSESTMSQFGVGVSAKIFKNATDRNSVKRLTREAWRLQKHLLKPKVTIFFVYTEKVVPKYEHLFGAVGKVIDKLNKFSEPV